MSHESIEDKRKRNREYYYSHKEIMQKQHKEWISKNKEQIKEYNAKNESRFKQYRKEYYIKNIEYIKERTRVSGKKHYAKNKERECNMNKEWRSKNKEHTREYYLKKNHGISLVEYGIMFEKQNGCCIICGKHQNELNKQLFVDHNHKTGDVRGLLCNNCNNVLGYAEENINTLQKAIKYLE